MSPDLLIGVAIALVVLWAYVRARLIDFTAPLRAELKLIAASISSNPQASEYDKQFVAYLLPRALSSVVAWVLVVCLIAFAVRFVASRTYRRSIDKKMRDTPEDVRRQLIRFVNLVTRTSLAVSPIAWIVHTLFDVVLDVAIMLVRNTTADSVVRVREKSVFAEEKDMTFYLGARGWDRRSAA
jgi:hypothetical protein